MRAFKTKSFRKFADKEGIDDDALRETVSDLLQGKIDADLGGGVIKQRIARQGEGKSGGYRVLIAFRFGARVVFVAGFAKSRRDNISQAELETARKLASQYFNATHKSLNRAVKDRLIWELSL
jgi:hypothetical protein